jgi:hypothetical protein
VCVSDLFSVLISFVRNPAAKSKRNEKEEEEEDEVEEGKEKHTVARKL